MGYIRTIREAVAAVLIADVDVAAAFAKGRIYDFATTAKWPGDLTKSDCPALVVGPGRAPRRYATNRNADVQVGVDLTIVSDSRDAGEVEDLFCLIEDAINANAPSFGLAGAASPHLVDIRDADFAPFEEAVSQERGIWWKCETGIIATIRRTV